jgi:MFS family permease
VLAFTPQLLGVTFSAGSVGALVAALTANRIGRLLGVGPTIVISAVVFSPAFLLVALAPPDLALPLVVVAIFLGSFAGVVYNINQVSFRQAITPERMQGRMNATMRFIVWGTIPPANLLGGFLGGAIGLHETIWVSAILSVSPFLAVLLSPVRSIREMPEPVEDVPSAETFGEAVDETPRPIPAGGHAPVDEEAG